MEKEFVTLSQKEFEDSLTGDFEIVEDSKSKEIIYSIGTSNENINIRVYSTVDIRTGQTRDKGKDAIRVVFWDNLNNRPIGKGKKILRVEGATTISDRISSRVQEFIGSAHDQNVIDFQYVRAILSSKAISWMGFAQSLLESLDKYGSLTDGQLAYVIGDSNPKGKPTMESQVKIKDPDFMEIYFESLDDEEDDNEKELVSNETGDKVNGPGTKEQNSKKTDKRVEIVLDVSGDRVPTSEYQDFQYPFESFNPVQSLVYPHRGEDRNMIVGANTTAGKTICAELLMDDVLAKGQRVIYLSPLKALTSEKYEDWQIRFPNEKITIMTGDYTLSEQKKQELGKSRIIVMTSEMCDSRTRKYHSEKNFWMDQVGLVIVDESHILTTERGHAVESGIMRFTRLNPRARILFLSATMPNVAELGGWLSDLNGKETTVIFSTWRPVELQLNFMEYPIALNKWGREDYWSSQEAKRQMVVDTILSKPDEKFLCFVHDKGTGRDIVNRLAEHNIVAHFHSADLELKDRLEIEGQFQSKENGIRVLVSTSTLAWGRNLPARNVVICGVHRGINTVDELDIVQMAGRGGRFGIDDAGFVYLIIPQGSTNTWKDVFVNPRPVLSVLNNHQIMAFHALAEVSNKVIQCAGDLLNWYSRSLAFKQNSTFSREDAEALSTELTEMQMIDEHFNITNLGRVSAMMYFSPYDIDAWHKNFGQIFEDNLTVDDTTLAWALGDVPSNDMGYIPKPLEQDVKELRWLLKNRGVTHTSNGIVSALAIYSQLSGQDGEAYLKPFKRAVVFDIQRQVQAISMIDGMYAMWNQENLWKALPIRVQYGVGMEMIELVSIPGVGGVRAKKLWAHDIRTIADVATTPAKKLHKIFNPATTKKIQKAAKEMMK